MYFHSCPDCGSQIKKMRINDCVHIWHWREDGAYAQSRTDVTEEPAFRAFMRKMDDAFAKPPKRFPI